MVLRHVFAINNLRTKQIPSIMERVIKMDEVLKHLAHKERHIFDLASFLKNKCENTPNYTLLLGASNSSSSP